MFQTQLAAAAMLVLLGLPAARVADDVAEMSFRYESYDARKFQMGLHETIYADGVITPGTTNRLKAFIKTHEMVPGSLIVLSSPGGDLNESIQIGLLIRGLSFNTQVGAYVAGQTKDRGGCYSACTFAFIGGTYRYVSPDAPFGVHRFSVVGNTMSGDIALDISQVQSGRLSGYVAEMGVNPQFLVQMGKVGPNEINLLSQVQLASLNVTTKLSQTSWDIKTTDQGDFYLLGSTTDLRGTHKIIFACPPKGGGPPFISLMYNVDPSEGPLIASSIASLALRVDEADVEIPHAEILKMPEFRGQYVTAMIKLDSKTIGMMNNAKELGFAMIPANRSIYMGFDGDFESGRAKVFGYIKSCH